MKASEIVRIIEKTGRTLQSTDPGQPTHNDTVSHYKSMKPMPPYVIAFKVDNELRYTHADTVDEIIALIKTIDVKLVYDTNRLCRCFYRVV